MAENKAMRIINLPVELLTKIFLLLSHKTLHEASKACKKFHETMKSPALKALYFKNKLTDRNNIRYGDYLAFYNIYKKQHKELTLELTDALINFGAPIPKYLV